MIGCDLMRHSDPLKDKQLTHKCTDLLFFLGGLEGGWGRDWQSFPYCLFLMMPQWKKWIRGLSAWDNDSLPVASCPHPEALWVSHHWRAQVLKCAAVLPNNKAGVKIIAFVVLVSSLILSSFCNFFPSFPGAWPVQCFALWPRSKEVLGLILELHLPVSLAVQRPAHHVDLKLLGEFVCATLCIFSYHEITALVNWLLMLEMSLGQVSDYMSLVACPAPFVRDVTLRTNNFLRILWP